MGVARTYTTPHARFRYHSTLCPPILYIALLALFHLFFLFLYRLTVVGNLDQRDVFVSAFSLQADIEGRFPDVIKGANGICLICVGVLTRAYPGSCSCCLWSSCASHTLLLSLFYSMPLCVCCLSRCSLFVFVDILC